MGGVHSILSPLLVSFSIVSSSSSSVFPPSQHLHQFLPSPLPSTKFSSRALVLLPLDSFTFCRWCISGCLPLSNFVLPIILLPCCSNSYCFFLHLQLQFPLPFQSECRFVILLVKHNSHVDFVNSSFLFLPILPLKVA